ncbi:MAG: NAD(P)H-hydrate dehydratase [Methylobacteriaceae bacterium]|nr:NAD(P)H-hydrate dehydratase [Methylobacteriaceae bacterium]
MTQHLLTTTEMAQADRLTIAAGTPGIELMERAGLAVAAAAGRLAAVKGPGHRRLAVICGPGNNGGDGFVAARILRSRGVDVTVALLGSVSRLRGDAAEAARRLGDVPGEAAAIDVRSADVIIDALFGAGLARDLDGDAHRIVERINAGTAPVLAVDVPSGVDGNTGMVRGIAVRAAATVTFFRKKPGHLLLPGRILCGNTEVADIGIAPEVLDAVQPRTFINEPGLWKHGFAFPQMAGHKYDRGHALVLSGGPTQTGAARLAARGALRAGAGLVTVASPEEALHVNAAHLTAIMLMHCDGPEELAEILADARKNAVALGPALGVGKGTRALVETALARPGDADVGAGRAAVLDADALTSFAGDAGALASLVSGSGGPVVITPHEGEFARLFSAEDSISRAASKLERARRAAGFLGATVVLKGPDTVAAHPDGRAAIGQDLPPWLATAGSGDVLTGIVCGLLAQGMPAFDAASCGIWMHGEAAGAFGPGLIAEDLPEALPTVIRNLAAHSVGLKTGRALQPAVTEN